MSSPAPGRLPPCQTGRAFGRGFFSAPKAGFSTVRRGPLVRERYPFTALRRQNENTLKTLLTAAFPFRSVLTNDKVGRSDRE